MEDIELAFAARALGLDIHPLQEIGISFGVDDDHDLVFARGVPPADVLSDEEFGQTCFAHPCRSQNQGVAHALTQRQADVHLVGFDAVQARQAAHWRQRPHRIERHVPAGEFR